MAVKYKIDVLKELKAHGYNTSRLRKEKIIAEGVLQSFRENRLVSWANINRLCMLLQCQPGDIVEYVPDTDGEG